MRPAVPLLLAVIALAGAADASERLAVPYEMFRLPNGLTVILHEDHSVPIVSVNAGTTSAPGARRRAAPASPTSSSTSCSRARRTCRRGVRPLARGGGRRQQRLDE